MAAYIHLDDRLGRLGCRHLSRGRRRPSIPNVPHPIPYMRPLGQGLPTDPWELICVPCGDDRGTFDRQTELVKRIRGPYRDQAAADAAAIAHSREATIAESPE